MKLQEFQRQLKDQDIEAFLVTKKNMYLNQDVTPEENNLLHLSGFSGSQGYMLVTPYKAWLLVDSRYSIQARLETNPEHINVVDIKSFLPTIVDILKEQNISPPQARLGTPNALRKILKSFILRQALAILLPFLKFRKHCSVTSSTFL